MRSQETFHLFKSAKEIRVALQSDGDRIGGQLNEQYPPPEIDGEPLIDHRRQMQYMLHELDRTEADMVAAEDGYQGQLAANSRLQRERDEVVSANYGKLLAARQGLDGLLGTDAGFEMALVSGNTPRLPEKVMMQLEQSAKLLRNPTVDLPPVKVGGFTVEPGGVADDLEAGKLEVQDVLDRLDLGRKSAESLLLVKRQQIDEFRRTILWAGRSSEGLFLRAGEPELAERIRSSTRRPLRPSEEEQEESGDEAAETPAEDGSDAGGAPGADPAEEPSTAES